MFVFDLIKLSNGIILLLTERKCAHLTNVMHRKWKYMFAYVFLFMMRSAEAESAEQK